MKRVLFALLLMKCTHLSIAQEKPLSEAQWDSIAKASFLKRIAAQEAAGMESALQAIKKAREEKATEISIVGFPKSELPDITDLKHVESFSCKRCTALNLDKLFSQLEQLPKLKTLTLNSCSIKVLPASIELLKNVETLSLKDNLFKTLPASLSHLSKLKKLDLEHCGYLLDENLWEALRYSPVEELNFSASELYEIHENIKLLTSLKSLDLSINDLETLPASFGELKSLEKLNLKQNLRLNLPAIFSVLRNNTSLQELHLNECLLQHLPVEVGEMRQLISLNLQGNQLIDVPAEIGKLTQLQVLDLGGLPNGFRYNRIENIPASFAALKNLKKLNLFGNRITQLPNLSSLNNLEELNLSQNQLKEIPEWVCSLSKLQTLDFSANSISHIPPCIGQLSSLQNLSLNGFFFHTPEKKINFLPAEICSLQQLKTLTLKDNVIENLPECIGNLKELVLLDARDNLLSSLPESITQLKKLEKLYLKANELAAVPGNFSQLTSLKEIDFSFNPKMNFDALFEKLKTMKHLEFIDISFNGIEREKVIQLKQQLPNTKIARYEH